MAKRQPGDQGRGDRRCGPCLRTNVPVLARVGDPANSVPWRDLPPNQVCASWRATTAFVLAAAPASLCLCHGFDSQVDCVVVTVGDHRTVCSPQPAAADRRPPARGAALPVAAKRPAGVASENVERKCPRRFGERGEVRRGGISGLQLRREVRGRRRATRARRFGGLRCLDVRACDFHRALRQRRTRSHEARACRPAPLMARIIGHGLGLAARHYTERDGVQGAALRPAGGGISG